MFLLDLSPLSGNFALYFNLNRDTLYFPYGMQSISINPIDILWLLMKHWLNINVHRIWYYTMFYLWDENPFELAQNLHEIETVPPPVMRPQLLTSRSRPDGGTANETNTKKNLVRQKPSSINCVPYIKYETSFGRRAQLELCHKATFAQIMYPTQFLDHSWPIRQLFPATVGNKYSNNAFFGYC